MSAPAGIAHAAQWQAWTATWAYLLAPDEPAGHCRPLGAGARPMTQHEGVLSDRTPRNEETALRPEDGFDGIVPSPNEEAFHA